MTSWASRGMNSIRPKYSAAGSDILREVSTKCILFWFVTTCCSEKSHVSQEKIAPIFRVEEYAKQ
jgi:hypothetical protein